MLTLLAQTDSYAKAYGLIVITAIIGMTTILLLLIVFLGRRWTSRQLKQIEQDRAQRRAMRSAGRVDAWQAGAERYVDHDKLPDTDADTDDDASPDGQDEPEPYDDEDDPPPPGWDEPGPEDEDDDPYGLFDGAPYREDDEDERDDNAGFDDDEGEDWDEDEDDGWDDEDEADEPDDDPRGR